MEENVASLRRRISELETINDQLASELRYLDTLLKQVGFVGGVETLKAAAIEILNREDFFEEE